MRSVRRLVPAPDFGGHRLMRNMAGNFPCSPNDSALPARTYQEEIVPSTILFSTHVD